MSLSRAGDTGANLETALYLPVKRFLEKLGFTVKGEIGGCDLVALSPDDPPSVGNGTLKLTVNVDLVLQGRGPPGAGTLNHGGLRARMSTVFEPRIACTSMPPGLTRERVTWARSVIELKI